MVSFESLDTVLVFYLHSNSHCGRIFSRFDAIHERYDTSHDGILCAYARIARKKIQTLL